VIVASQTMLLLYRADGRVDLDLLVEAVVIVGGEVIQKIARPGAAVAVLGIETTLNSQRLAFVDRHQRRLLL